MNKRQMRSWNCNTIGEIDRAAGTVHVPRPFLFVRSRVWCVVWFDGEQNAASDLSAISARTSCEKSGPGTRQEHAPAMCI
jgi:hypothetical protein